MATLAHMRFGHDIIFTYGPLGYVLHGIPAPALARSSAYFTLALASVGVFGVWTVLRGRASVPARIAFLFAALLAAEIGLDYFAFVGVLALLARAARAPRLAPILAVVIGATAAFGVLSKETLGVDVIASAGTFWGAQIVVGPRRRRVAGLLAATVATAVIAIVVLAEFRGSIADVTYYAAGAREIVGGYAAAMSLPSDHGAMPAALIIGALICAAAVALARDGKTPFAAATLVALFLAWKHGLVRADAHVIFFFTVAAAIAALIAMIGRGPLSSAAGIVAAGAASLALAWTVGAYHVGVTQVFAFARVIDGAKYLLDPIGTTTAQLPSSSAALAADRLDDVALHSVDGASVDVIGAETAIVPASGLRWQPLPVFQSYTAYTPRLDDIDREALATRGADIEMFRWEDIDGRYPLSAEPSTFVELLCRYRTAGWSATTHAKAAFIPLLRQPIRRCTEQAAGSDRGTIAQTYAVPRVKRSGDFIRATFALRLTTLGVLANALWRPPFARIAFTYRDGTSKTWRLVTATIGDGLVVSPVPRNNAEVRRFFAGLPTVGADVASVRLDASPRFYQLDGVRFTLVHR